MGLVLKSSVVCFTESPGPSQQLLAAFSTGGESQRCSCSTNSFKHSGSPRIVSVAVIADLYNITEKRSRLPAG